MLNDLLRVTEYTQGRGGKGTWVRTSAPGWAGGWERVFQQDVFLSQGPGALRGRGEPLRHAGPRLPHAAPAAVPASGSDRREAASMGLPQPRLPPPALPAGPAAAGCRPELRGQVRVGQGVRGRGWVQLAVRGQVRAGQRARVRLEVRGWVRAGRGHGWDQFRGWRSRLCVAGREG